MFWNLSSFQNIAKFENIFLLFLFDSKNNHGSYYEFNNCNALAVLECGC